MDRCELVIIHFLQVALSVVLFVLLPFIFGSVTRLVIMRCLDRPAALAEVQRVSSMAARGALLVTLVLIFIFQGRTLVNNWQHIFLIMVPLELQTFLIFTIAYGSCFLLRVPFSMAAPSSFIASSNFFELGVSVAIMVLGLRDTARLWCSLYTARFLLQRCGGWTVGQL